MQIQVVTKIRDRAKNLFPGNKDSPEGGLDGLMQVFWMILIWVDSDYPFHYLYHEDVARGGKEGVVGVPKFCLNGFSQRGYPFKRYRAIKRNCHK